MNFRILSFLNILNFYVWCYRETTRTRFFFLNVNYFLNKRRFKHFRINKFPSKLLFANFLRILLGIIYNLVRKFPLREKREQDASPRKFLPKRHKNLPPKRILFEEKKKSFWYVEKNLSPSLSSSLLFWREKKFLV